MLIKEYVAKYDPQNQFEVLRSSWTQIEYAENNSYDLSLLNKKSFSNIIITGLGGSAISGDLLKNFLNEELSLPIAVNRNYNLPAFASEDTLVICSSYSGNTEETLSVLNQAIEKKCSIVLITTGGEAQMIAEKNRNPVIKLKAGYQPRYALGISFFTLLRLFEELKLISNHSEIINQIKLLWKSKAEEYTREENIPYTIANELIGFLPIIYSVADSTYSVGYRFKCQLNENSKVHAFHNEIPEMNHNEIIGWETYNEAKFPVKVVTILDVETHPQLVKRFEFLNEIFAKNKIDVINLSSSEKKIKVRILDLIYLCDWITYYLAVVRGYDPSEIDFIHQLKNRL